MYRRNLKKEIGKSTHLIFGVPRCKPLQLIINQPLICTKKSKSCCMDARYDISSLEINTNITCPLFLNLFLSVSPIPSSLA